MTPLAAILLVCSHGDRDVAADVFAFAVKANVRPELALAVACVESGLQGPNPMGVMFARPHGAQMPCGAEPTPAGVCLAWGVRSLANRLRAADGNERLALARYNGGAHAAKYAAKVLKIARFVRVRSKR